MTCSGGWGYTESVSPRNLGRSILKATSGLGTCLSGQYPGYLQVGHHWSGYSENPSRFLFQLLRIELNLLNFTLRPLIRCALTFFSRFGLYSYRSVWLVAIIFPIYRRNPSPHPPSFSRLPLFARDVKTGGRDPQGRLLRHESFLRGPVSFQTPIPPLTLHTPPLYRRSTRGNSATI